jgi:cytochrome P450
MFIAAGDTSTVTVQRAMAQLLRNPDKTEKVRAELAARLSPDRLVKDTDLDDLPYVQAVVKETRETVADAVSLGGFLVPMGTGGVISL